MGAIIVGVTNDPSNNYEIVASGTIIIEPKIIREGKNVGHIEDIVVAEHMRGKGVSHKILEILKNYISFNKSDIIKGINIAFWLIKKAVESNKDAIFSAVFLIIGTPFFSFISSKTEEAFSGVKYPFKWRTFFKELKRGILLSFRNSLKQFGLFILVLLLSFIPIIDIITPLLMFIIQAYFNGILMTDYTLERHGISIKDSEFFYKVNKIQMFAIGIGFMFLLLIPVIGWFIAPTYGLVASFLFYSKHLEK
jgi:uncharacterized protein involved in cysteine biosynthesis